jgi:hypothetical protein
MVLSTSLLLINATSGFRAQFLHGGLIGFATIGVLTDLIAKGKYLYTCIALLHLTGMVLLLINIVA